MINNDPNDIERRLRELLHEIHKLELPQQRIEHKRLLHRGQELRLQLLYLGRADLVADYDKQTVPLNINNESDKQRNYYIGKVEAPRSDELLRQENEPLIHQDAGQEGLKDGKTLVKGFSLPGDFFVSQEAPVSPINEPESKSSSDLGGNVKIPRVFIQYAQVDELYRERALELAFRLRSDGVESIIDQFDPNPKEGWPTWMTKQLREADFVLVLCSKENLERFDKHQPPPLGTGATWEGHLIQQYLHNAGVINQKFIPAFLREEDRSFVPEVLQAFTHYSVYEVEGYNRLLRFLTNQPEIEIPPVNPIIKKMPPRRP